MAEPQPADLSPFRSMVNFSAGAYVALVSMVVSNPENASALRNRIELNDPAIGQFGLATDWELPAGEADRTLVFGYHVISGNNAESPFGTLNLVNLARTLSEHPDENRTHVVLDFLLEPFESDPTRTGHIRCEVYRGPPLEDMIAYLASGDIFNAFGDSFDTVRTAFQYRRDGVVGLIGEFEQAITVGTSQKRMRIRIPVVGEDHTPIFELI